MNSNKQVSQTMLTRITFFVLVISIALIIAGSIIYHSNKSTYDKNKLVPPPSAATTIAMVNTTKFIRYYSFPFASEQ